MKSMTMEFPSFLLGILLTNVGFQSKRATAGVWRSSAKTSVDTGPNPKGKGAVNREVVDGFVGRMAQRA
jgi:hypothetical protein